MAVIECQTTGFIEKYFNYGYTSAEDYQELITYFTSLLEVDTHDSWFKKNGAAVCTINKKANVAQNLSWLHSFW